jgi:hypothetical protein
MKRAIACSINTIEELERVKQEEAEVLVALEALTVPLPISTTLPLLGDNFVLL